MRLPLKLPKVVHHSNPLRSCTREHVRVRESRGSEGERLLSRVLTGPECSDVVNPDRVALALLSPLARA